MDDKEPPKRHAKYPTFRAVWKVWKAPRKLGVPSGTDRLECFCASLSRAYERPERITIYGPFNNSADLVLQWSKHLWFIHERPKHRPMRLCAERRLRRTIWIFKHAILRWSIEPHSRCVLKCNMHYFLIGCISGFNYRILKAQGIPRYPRKDLSRTYHFGEIHYCLTVWNAYRNYDFCNLHADAFGFIAEQLGTLNSV